MMIKTVPMIESNGGRVINYEVMIDAGVNNNDDDGVEKGGG